MYRFSHRSRLKKHDYDVFQLIFVSVSNWDLKLVFLMNNDFLMRVAV